MNATRPAIVLAILCSAYLPFTANSADLRAATNGTSLTDGATSPKPAVPSLNPAPQSATPVTAPKPPAPSKNEVQGPAIGAPSSTSAPRDAAAKRAEALAQTRRALAAPVAGITFEKTPLRDALTQLAEAGKFNLVFDPAFKESAPDATSRPITTRLAGITYDDAINMVLPKEFGYRTEPGYVLVSTLQKSWLPLASAVYRAQLKQTEPAPVVVVGMGMPQASQTNGQQIGASYRGPNPSEWSVTASQQSQRTSGGTSTFIATTPPDPVRDAPPEQIAAMVKRLVRHALDRRIAPWDDEGGPARIEVVRSKLVITQTEHGHRAISNLVPTVQ